jgi:ferrous iron transport protein B
LKIALAGTPNVGKSTLFNTITGLNQKITNAPGTTVLVEYGKWGKHELVDLPGLYSFVTVSPDEEAAAQALVGANTPDVIVHVFDGAHPAKSLYLLAQLLAFNIPIVVACTMLDVAKRRKLEITTQKLSGAIGGIHVVAVDPRTGAGVNELQHVVTNMTAELATSTQKACENIACGTCPIVSICKEGATQDLSVSLEQTVEYVRNHADELFNWVKQVERELKLHDIRTNTLTDKLDAILLNSFAAPPIFLLLMLGVFTLTTVCAAPFIDFFDGPLRDVLSSALDYDHWTSSLLVHGLLDGVITVLSFLPPLFFMFVSLTLLEGSGVMSRIAVVADRLMRLIGLDGRALMPMIVGYGCNLPAISATRIISNSAARRLTGMLIPFTLCSARLAVFLVIAYQLFPNWAGLVIFGLYIASIVAIILIGLIIRPFYHKNYCEMPFIIALPSYQVPLVSPFVRSVGLKLLQFAKEAGKIIVLITVVVWLLQAIPLPNTVNQDGESYEFAAVDDIHDSVFGATADAITPVFTPLGFGDWHISSALLSGFVAKEALVGTLEQTYNVDEDDEESMGLQLAADLDESSDGHSTLAIFSLLLFILLYTPCMATIVLLAKDFGKKQAFISLGLSLGFSYILSLLIFQIGILL